MSNLAASSRILGLKQEALKLNWQALEIQKRVMGYGHSDTVFSMLIRLCILGDLGMTEQLPDLLRVAFPSHEQVLGMDHPNTLWLKKSFATDLELL
jgi:hypothetical protein